MVLGQASQLDAIAGQGATLTMIVESSSSTDVLPEAAFVNNLKCAIVEPILPLPFAASAAFEHTPSASRDCGLRISFVARSCSELGMQGISCTETQ